MKLETQDPHNLFWLEESFEELMYTYVIVVKRHEKAAYPV